MYHGRRPWRDDEKNAIIEGIRNGLLGKWAEIKKTSGFILLDRTSGQIKDCFRTMHKRGELKDAGEVSSKKNKKKKKNYKNDKTEENTEEQSEAKNQEGNRIVTL